MGCWNERFLHYVFPSNSSSYHWQKPERNSWQHQLYNTSNSTYIQTFSAGGATWGPSCKLHTALPGGHLKRDKQTNHVQHKYKYRTREIACHKKIKKLNLRRNSTRKDFIWSGKCSRIKFSEIPISAFKSLWSCCLQCEVCLLRWSPVSSPGFDGSPVASPTALPRTAAMSGIREHHGLGGAEESVWRSGVPSHKDIHLHGKSWGKKFHFIIILHVALGAGSVAPMSKQVFLRESSQNSHGKPIVRYWQGALTSDYFHWFGVTMYQQGKLSVPPTYTEQLQAAFSKFLTHVTADLGSNFILAFLLFCITFSCKCSWGGSVAFHWSRHTHTKQRPLTQLFNHFAVIRMIPGSLAIRVAGD